MISDYQALQFDHSHSHYHITVYHISGSYCLALHHYLYYLDHLHHFLHFLHCLRRSLHFFHSDYCRLSHLELDLSPGYCSSSQPQASSLFVFVFWSTRRLAQVSLFVCSSASYFLKKQVEKLFFATDAYIMGTIQSVHQARLFARGVCEWFDLFF